MLIVLFNLHFSFANNYFFNFHFEFAKLVEYRMESNPGPNASYVIGVHNTSVKKILQCTNCEANKKK